MFKIAVKEAESNGVKLAIENYIDYNFDEILWLLQEVDSNYFGVNFDSGNFLRVLDDPVKAMEKLAPYVMATHIKDMLPVQGVSVDEWYFFSCVPTGKGLIDNQRIAQLLVEQKYEGFFAVETDTLHPDYVFQELNVVTKSVQQLKIYPVNVYTNRRSMKTMNVGIIGYQFMGKAHSNGWIKAPLFFDLNIKPELKVACGRNESAVKAFADKWGWQEVETDWKKVVENPDVDIVDISLPQHLHYDVAIAAAKNGKHIFCEKPMAHSRKQAEEMLKAA